MRWLLLDVGGVLADVDDATWPREFAARWADRLGLALDEFAARVEAAQLPDATLRDDVEEEFWSAYGAAVGAGPATLDAMRADFWETYCGRPNLELLDELATWHGRAGMAILSNSGDGARREEERRFGFAELFDPICYSHEMGVKKPDPAAYGHALARMGAAPADVLFVDNTPVCVEGASACGIRSVLHTSNAATLAAVRDWLARP